MLLYLYSRKKAEHEKTGWYRGGFEIKCFKNNILKKGNSFYYTFQFKLTFCCNLILDEKDEVFVSSIHPYSFSDLTSFLQEICVPSNYDKIRSSLLARTISTNPLYLVLITNFSASFEEIGNRKAIVFTARIHPRFSSNSETNSSFIIEGIIRFLLGNSKEANKLRNEYLFKIVPMINPDGVIAGNCRCS